MAAGAGKGIRGRGDKALAAAGTPLARALALEGCHRGGGDSGRRGGCCAELSSAFHFVSSLGHHKSSLNQRQTPQHTYTYPHQHMPKHTSIPKLERKPKEEKKEKNQESLPQLEDQDCRQDHSAKLAPRLSNNQH